MSLTNVDLSAHILTTIFLHAYLVISVYSCTIPHVCVEWSEAVHRRRSAIYCAIRLSPHLNSVHGTLPTFKPGRASYVIQVKAPQPCLSNCSSFSRAFVDVLSEATKTHLISHVGIQGTKNGCGEGGCGACSVQVHNLDINTGKEGRSSDTLLQLPVLVVSLTAAGNVNTKCINACLCPVGSLDGCSVVTVEGMGNAQTGFNAVQGVYQPSSTFHLHKKLLLC